MLARLSGKEYYWFLDGYIGYNKITIALEDQHITTFICPYGTLAFRRMPFYRWLLCIQELLFHECMNSLEEVLEKWEETCLVINLEKCHFMVRKGIVLGHKFSNVGLKVDPSKTDLVSKLPPPSDVKPLNSFLVHEGFYRRFITGFCQITKPLSNILCAYQPYVFCEKCNHEDLERRVDRSAYPLN